MARMAETFAPESFYKSWDELIKPTQGSGAEVIVMWKERVIGTYHFHSKKVITMGTHPSCDVSVPILNSYVNKLPLLQLNQGLNIFLQPGIRGELVAEESHQYLDQLEAHQVTSGRLNLKQKEMVRLQITEGLQIIIRYSQQSPRPKLIPFVDMSSNGFLSLVLALIFSCMMALYVQMNPVIKSSYSEDNYPIAFLLENPIRMAKVLTPKIKIDLAKIIKPKKVIKKIRQSIKKSVGAPRLIKRQGVKSQKVGSTRHGGAIKTSKIQGAQSKSERLKNSGLFSVFGNGKNDRLDKSHTGNGELYGLAKNATGKAGDVSDRPGSGLGHRLKETGSALSGDSNVGVEGITSGTGKRSGFGSSNLGSKASLSIATSGDGAIYSGKIDREAIRKVFYDNARSLRSCYERQLNRNTQLSGKMLLDFDIGEQGRVVGRPRIKRSGSTLMNSAMSQCILDRLKTWKFPEPPRSQVVNVIYPLAFSGQ